MNPWLLIVVAMVFSAGWMIPDYVGRMSIAGHYQFFPMVFLFVMGMLYMRLPRLLAAATPPSIPTLKVTLGVTVCLLLTGHLISSHLVGLIGIYLGICWLIYARLGWGGFKAAMPVLLLLVFAIPLPMKLDTVLIVEMQFLASFLASYVLDGLGFLHFREGVTLVTEQSQFLTEEACSGIRSLFSSLFVVAAVCVAMELSNKRLIFNLIQTLLWVLVGNAVRVAAVVILADRVSPWFATGIGHEMLGMAVFGFILFAVASTDQLIWMFSMYKPTVPLSFRKQFNSAMRDLRLKKNEPDQSQEKLASLLPGLFSTASFPIPQSNRLAWFLALGLVGVIGLRVFWVHGSDIQVTGIRSMPSMEEPLEDLFPKSLSGWELVGFEHVERDTMMG